MAGHKPFSTASERNREPILAVLAKHFADRSHVLEIGSGTGQHAVHFARGLPHLTWQCSDISGQLPGHELAVGEDFVVVVMGAGGAREHTELTVVARGGEFQVDAGHRRWKLEILANLRDIAIVGRVDGKPFCAQIERFGHDFRIRHHGAQLDAKVMRKRAAELYALMPVKPKADLSKFLLSPMPGLLVDVAVQPGQAVRAGEKLAVIEAMKMENVLFATQDCRVGNISAAKGESLAVDQVIMEFA